MLLPEPKLYKGNIFVDDRGIVGFNNDLDLSEVKRFYTISNHTPGFIRAWHGHEREAKFFTMLSGSATIMAVHMILSKNIWELNWDITFKETISSEVPTVYYIPPGYANGFKLLTQNSKLMVFSTSTTKESAEDDIRFPYNTANDHFFEAIQR